MSKIEEKYGLEKGNAIAIFIFMILVVLQTVSMVMQIAAVKSLVAVVPQICILIIVAGISALLLTATVTLAYVTRYKLHKEAGLTDKN